MTMTVETSTNTCAQPDTKSNPSPTSKHHLVVNIQLNIVACPTYPEKFIRDDVVALSVPTLIVIVTLPNIIRPTHMLTLGLIGT